MRPALLSEASDPVLIQLNEWDAAGPRQDERLKSISFRGDPASQRLIDTLASRVSIREDYAGLSVATTSYVGRIDIGQLRVAIRPKLAQMPLTRLFRYAYGIRNLETHQPTETPTVRNGLHDLLVAMLCAEISELIYRGLSRRYVPMDKDVDSLRGQILIDQVVRRAGIVSAELPCRFYERLSNWRLNQVLRSGIHLATQVAEDSQLKRLTHQLAARFGDIAWNPRLTLDEIDRAELDLTRLTEVNRSALTIIRLLRSSIGAALDSGDTAQRTPGFLFDMNLFFQRLLSRFLRENLVAGSIDDEKKIRNLYFYEPGGNPKGRPQPTPRPDLALSLNGKLRAFLDAKYRDVWERGFSAGWLYQLSTYALASPSRTSILLYASMSPHAREERIEVRPPLSWLGSSNGLVIIRPVPLARLAALLAKGAGERSMAERRDLAERLVAI